MIGAICSGSVAFMLIQSVKANSKVELDAILAVVLSTFFGLGMVLKSYIQGNPDYGRARRQVYSGIFSARPLILCRKTCKSYWS